MATLNEPKKERLKEALCDAYCAGREDGPRTFAAIARAARGRALLSRPRASCGELRGTLLPERCHTLAEVLPPEAFASITHLRLNDLLLKRLHPL